MLKSTLFHEPSGPKMSSGRFMTCFNSNFNKFTSKSASGFVSKLMSFNSKMDLRIPCHHHISPPSMDPHRTILSDFRLSTAYFGEEKVSSYLARKSSIRTQILELRSTSPTLMISSRQANGFKKKGIFKFGNYSVLLVPFRTKLFLYNIYLIFNHSSRIIA